MSIPRPKTPFHNLLFFQSGGMVWMVKSSGLSVRLTSFQSNGVETVALGRGLNEYGQPS